MVRYIARKILGDVSWCWWQWWTPGVNSPQTTRWAWTWFIQWTMKITPAPFLAFPGLTVSICENFRTFPPLSMNPWYSEYILLNGEGAQKCIFNALLIIPFLVLLVVFASICNAYLYSINGSTNASKKLLFVKTSFNSCIIITRSQIYLGVEQERNQVFVRRLDILLLFLGYWWNRHTG